MYARAHARTGPDAGPDTGPDAGPDTGPDAGPSQLGGPRFVTGGSVELGGLCRL